MGAGGGGGGGEGKETPAAEPRHFTERPQMGSLPRDLHCHVKCHMRTDHFYLLVNLSENRIAAGNLFTPIQDAVFFEDFVELYVARTKRR